MRLDLLIDDPRFSDTRIGIDETVVSPVVRRSLVRRYLVLPSSRLRYNVFFLPANQRSEQPMR